MTRITFHNLTVDQISSSSGIYSGTNAQSKYRSKVHKNEGSGMVVGNKNIMHHNKHLIIKNPHDQGE